MITVWEAGQILSSSVEYLSAPLYSSSIVRGGSSDRDWKKGVVGQASSKVLEDRVHAVCVDFLDILSKSPGEVLDRLILLLEDGL